MQNKKRLFIGLPVRANISGLVEMLKTTVTDVNYVHWIPGRKLHLTLAFIGDLDSSKAEYLIKKISKIDFKYQFDLSLEHTGMFMHTDGAPKIFWLGINRGLDKIIELQKLVSNLLHGCDVLFDDRKFIPHITLGRIKNDGRVNKINSEMYLNAVFSPIRFRVKSFHLYSSELLQQGVKYNSLAEVKLI